MLPLKEIQFLAKAYGKTEDEIKQAVSSDNEVSLGDMKGEFYTEEENAKRNEIVRKAGVEIGIKQLYKATGVEFTESDKTPEKAAELLKTHLSGSGDEGLKTKVKDLEKQLADLSKEDKDYAALQKEKETILNTYNTEKEEWQQKYSVLETETLNKEIDTMILGTIPDNTKISSEDLLLIGRNKFNVIKGDDNQFYIKNNDGSFITDKKMGHNLKASDVLKSYWEDNYIKKGNIDDPTLNNGNLKKGQKMSASEAQKYIQETTDLSLTSSEGLKMYTELQAGTYEG